MNDVVIRSATVVKNGEVTWPPPPVAVSAAAGKPRVDRLPAVVAARSLGWFDIALMLVATALLVGLALTRDSGLITDFTVFALACIVGWQVIWNVTASLHTPLMSVTNAISGIIIVGGMLQVGVDHKWASILGAAAIFVATINIAGGFLVTHRMLKMFRK
jgi:NAD(P) transhydrogenase subunit alpha